MSIVLESIQTGLKQAIAHARGEDVGVLIHKFEPIDVKSLRQRVGMERGEFAQLFGIGSDTVRHWENGDRTPKGPALVLLNLIRKEPDKLLRMIKTA
ncbi:MAG: type II toxin-antitoxin system MqsA family antitoxin [Planctomycetes bacterium]|nr:type II toxin-antitoxin system MqsA family antitoxin [Planctomycetota bacterium]